MLLRISRRSSPLYDVMSVLTSAEDVWSLLSGSTAREASQKKTGTDEKSYGYGRADICEVR
jgi:hypothetical protein